MNQRQSINYPYQSNTDSEVILAAWVRYGKEAVEKRLVADVPFGAFLSGGIVSSAVVGAMAQLSTQQVKTFNISFAEEAGIDMALSVSKATQASPFHASGPWCCWPNGIKVSSFISRG